MDDLKELFHRSAREAFANALETGEIIGVSKSFDRFIRTIYENTDNGSENLTTRGMDGQYERLTSMAIDVVWRNDFAASAATSAADSESLDRQFLFRFRSRRALYDCLSLTYPELMRGSGGTTTAAFTSTSAVPTGERGKANGAPRPLTLFEQEALASKVRTHVANVCQGNVPTILAKAKSGNIGPVSSRELAWRPVQSRRVNGARGGIFQQRTAPGASCVSSPCETQAACGGSGYFPLSPRASAASIQ